MTKVRTLLLGGVALGLIVLSFATLHGTGTADVSSGGSVCGDQRIDERLECLETQLEVVFANEGFDSAFNFVAKTARSGVACHMLMHALGIAVYNKSDSVQEALSYSNTACSGGFLHGLLEAHLMEQGATGSTEEMLQACDDLSEEKFSIRWECYHGLGHALMYVLENDIFESAKKCDLLGEGTPRERCYYGVFMENSYQHYYLYHGPPKKFIDSNDTLYPCSIMDERYKDACYRFSGRSYVLGVAGANKAPLSTLTIDDFREAFNVCKKIEGPETYRRNCIGSMPVYIRDAYQQDWEKSRAACSLLEDSAYESLCLSNLALLIRRHDTNREGLAHKFCAEVPIENQGTCKTAIRNDAWYSPTPFEGGY